MKKYLLQLGLAVFILFAIVFSVTTAAYGVKKKAAYNIPSERHILVIGNSHTECSIDDNILSTAENISSSGEHFMFSFLKAKKMIKENGQIDTVIIPVAETMLSKAFDERWATGETLKYHLEKDIFYAQYGDIPFEVCKSTDFLIGAIRAPLETIKLLWSGKTGMSGGYVHLDRHSVSDEVDDNMAPTAEIDTTSMQFAYLMKIKELCESKNIEFIMINTPKYKNGMFNDTEKFDSLRMVLIPDVTYMDFSDFPLQDSCYADNTHLNYKGAEIFSEYLKTVGFKPYRK